MGLQRGVMMTKPNERFDAGSAVVPCPCFDAKAGKGPRICEGRIPKIYFDKAL